MNLVERIEEPPMGIAGGLPDLELEIETEGEPDVVETEDGGVEVTFGQESDDPLPEEAKVHNANLVDFLDDIEELASELHDAYTADVNSLEEWRKTYEEGMKLLGLANEERTDPWDGACGIFHPLMTEAAVRFQSQAITEIFPAAGPVKSAIHGPETGEMMALAKRIQKEMNYQLTEKMVEYRDEKEALLFRTALAGSCFKKIYYDVVRRRARAMMVKAEDLVVNYGTTNLRDAQRITQVIRMQENDLKRLIAKGVYKNIDVQPSTESKNSTEDEEEEITGQERVYEADDSVILLEMHIDKYIDDPMYDDDMPRPYVVTMVKDTHDILAIRRNWEEGDEDFKPRQHFVHYKYLPGLGFYGIGLVQLVGGLTSGATSILRQLVDAGTLANLPAGFKTKSLRWKNQDDPIAPGEWRDVDVAAGAIRDNLMPLPYKEPSAVLFQLLQNVVDEGRRLGSIAEVDMSKMSGEAPVGTILAILERNLKVQTAVHSRLHASLREELGLIRTIIAKDMPPEYDYQTEGDFNRREDFLNGAVNISPVSDPNAATMSQRIVQHQAIMQNAAAAPHIYDMPLLHRSGLEILDWPNPEKLVPIEEADKPRDPVTENMNVLRGKPIRAFREQDHESHLAVHMAAMQDPKLQELLGQSQNGPAVMAAMEAHIAEHVAFQYRVEMERQLGVALPDEDTDLPPDVEANLSYLAAQAAQRVLGKHQQEAEAAANEQAANDPLTQLQNRELDIKERAIDEKAKDRESRERIEGAKLGVKLVTDDRQLDRADKTEGVRVGVQIADSIQRRQQEAINRALQPPAPPPKVK